MAESNFITAQVAQLKSPAGRPPRDIRKIDIITARQTQSLAILGAILANLSDDSILSPEMIINNLWAAQTLLQQAQEAASTL